MLEEMEQVFRQQRAVRRRTDVKVRVPPSTPCMPNKPSLQPEPPGNRTPMHVIQHEMLNKDLKTAFSDYFFKHFWASLLIYMCDFPLLVILILNMAYICGFNYILQSINAFEYLLKLLKGLYNVIVFERDRLNRIAFPPCNFNS